MGLCYFFLVGIQSSFFTLVPLYMIGDRKMSFAAMGWLSSAPFLTLYLSVLASGVVADTIMRKTGSVWHARVPLGLLAMLGSVTAFAIGISLESIPLMMFFLCLGSFMVGMGQVSVWSSVQDISAEGDRRAGHRREHRVLVRQSPSAGRRDRKGMNSPHR
jgi:MFS family permease